MAVEVGCDALAPFIEPEFDRARIRAAATYSHTSGEMELAIAQGLQKQWEASQRAEETAGEDWAHRRSG